MLDFICNKCFIKKDKRIIYLFDQATVYCQYGCSDRGGAGGGKIFGC